MKAECRIADSPGELWNLVSQRWLEISTDAIAKKGAFTVALSGGRTPSGLYRHLGECPGLPWNRTHIYQVDERFVPKDSLESNFKMIRESLLSSISETQVNVHRIPTESTSSKDAAVEYGVEIWDSFPGVPGELPAFDLVILGIGSDGHTASLFPGSGALDIGKDLTAAAVTAGGQERITMTMPLINHGAHIFFVVTGEEKAGMVGRIISGKNPALPASLVEPVDGTLTFFLDRKAAAMLPLVK